MPPRPILRSLTLILATTAAGIAVRFLPLGLPPFVVKYAGSMLWAALIYWLISTIFSRTPPFIALLIAACIATAVEFFKLYRSPHMDAFRTTLPGILLLGKYFSIRDIAAYWIAIAIATAFDILLRTPSAVHKRTV
jgi:hypothetical protein